MSEPLEFLTQLDIIEDFAIVGDRQIAIVDLKRLITLVRRSRIDSRKCPSPVRGP